MSLNYEILQPADYATAIEFSLASRVLLFPELYGSRIPKDIEYFEQYYISSPLGCFITVKEGAKLVGVIAYRAYDHRFDLNIPQGAVEVVKLFVLPEYRRRGIATKLCQMLFAQAQQKGIRHLYLHTHPFLPAAEQFWRLQGFEVIKREQLTMYDTIHMARSIGDGF